METRKPEAAKLVPKKKSTPKTSPAKSSAITDALLLLQQQGFTVLAPDLTAQADARENAAGVLGVIQHDDYVPKKEERPNAKKAALTITLAFPHSINGVVYGPGTVTLTPSKANLLQSLAHKDQISKEQEARMFETTGRCHIIVTQVDSLGRQAAIAQQVDERYFNTGAALMNAPVFREFTSSDIHR